MEIDKAVLASLVVGLADAVIIADRDGTIVFWNDAATNLFGWSASEAVGSPLDLIIPERLRQRHWDGYHRVMGTGETKYGRELLAVPGVRKDGARISLEFSIALLRDPEGGLSGAVAIVRDVTARWERDKALRERLAALESEAQQAAGSG